LTVPVDPRPSRPPEPDPADCCGEGCVNCVFDVYEAALQKYEADLAAWRARNAQGESHR
jgi:hypothetical protein